MPAVLVIIFLLLYIVYHTVKEAAHVILAVPFALTGGVFLQYLLGLQLQRRGVGWLYRALRHGHRNRHCHGRLSSGGRAEEARRARRPVRLMPI